MIRGVIFDLDDTLYNELEYVKQAFCHVSEYIEAVTGTRAQEIYNRCIYYLNTIGRGQIFNRLIDEYGFSESVGQLVSVYRNTSPALEMYEDAEKCINMLKEKNILTGIITDGCSVVQHNKIKGLKIEKDFDEIIVTDDYENAAKPSVFSYRMILDKWKNLMPDECIYIGDNPAKDFVGARKAGMKTARIVRPVGDNMKLIAKSGYEADMVIHNLMEIEKYLVGKGMNEL